MAVTRRGVRRSFLSALGLLLTSLAVGQPVGTNAQVASDDPAADAQAWVDRTLAGLTLERKVAQLISAPIDGVYVARDNPARREWMALARDHGIGAFVVYGGTPHETAHLLNQLQQVAEIPLLIAADFEGGPGQQFVGASEFPANMALAAIGSEELAYQVGQVGAREGRAIGIHVTYSPVVDIQTVPRNPVLSVRSFGRDLDLLGRLAGAYIRGYQENGMLATAKHYPGRGDVELIPGTEYTINRKPPSQLEREDFLAFRHAIDAGVAFVMSEHIVVPSVTDGSDLPASVEPKLGTEWLRHRLGFTGILTSDDLWYPKVTERFGAEEAGVLAIQAGHDMLLKPANPVATIRAVSEAVRAGRIPEARIDASVRKVLAAKTRVGLHRERMVDPAWIDAAVGIEAHQALVRSIAEQSLTVLVNDGVLPSSAPSLGRIAHVSIQRSASLATPGAVNQTLRDALDVQSSHLIRPDSSDGAREAAVTAARAADTAIVSLFSQRSTYRDNGALSEADRQLMARIVAAKPRSTIVMSYGNPYLIDGLARPAVFVVGYGEGGFYGNQLAYADALVRLLRGEVTPLGRLPVDVNAEFPSGSGVRF